VSDASARPRRLHPISIVAGSLKTAPGALIGMAGSFSLLVQRDPGLAVLVAGAMLLLPLAGSMISWWRFTFEVRAREIVIETGLFGRKRRVIPFDRVRDISIERPLLARLVGTAKVRIETGGAAADEGVLDMIALDEAQALREHIRRSNVLASPSQPSPAPADAQPERVIFAMTLGRVLGSGLLNFSLVFIVLVFGAFQYLEDLGVIDFEQLARSQEARTLAGTFSLRAGLLILAALLLLGIASGVVRTLARDYGFRLTAGPAGLRRRRGLFTLSEVLIPARRTEAARIDSGWLSGWLGWQSLAFQTLGAERKEGGVQVAAPFARPEETASILAEAHFPALPDEPLTRPPARALVRRCGPWLLLAGAVGLVGFLWGAAWWGVPVLVALALLEVPRWRREGYALDDRALYVRGGLLGVRLWIVPFEKLQTLRIKRGPLQRGLRLASLVPDTAGASPFSPLVVADLDEADADALAGRLLGAFHEARARVRAQARTAAQPSH